MPEPSGALSLAGVKAHITRNNLFGAHKRFVAVISGGNMNFGRLRFVAERAELGERREVLMSVKVPERPGRWVPAFSHSCAKSRFQLLSLDLAYPPHLSSVHVGCLYGDRTDALPVIQFRPLSRLTGRPSRYRVLIPLGSATRGRPHHLFLPPPLFRILGLGSITRCTGKRGRGVDYAFQSEWD